MAFNNYACIGIGTKTISNNCTNLFLFCESFHRLSDPIKNTFSLNDLDNKLLK